MPLDLSEIVCDGDLGQPFNIIRTTGAFGLGGWTANAPVNIAAFGIACPATDEELRMIPEGDRVEGSHFFASSTPIYKTRSDQNNPANSGISDQIAWNGQLYRIMSVGQWMDSGFYWAIGVREFGA